MSDNDGMKESNDNGTKIEEKEGKKTNGPDQQSIATEKRGQLSGKRKPGSELLHERASLDFSLMLERNKR